MAVVGLSTDPSRPSHGVARYLQKAGYRIVPVNPNVTMVLGERSFATLALAAHVHAIDVVDVFRRSEHAGAVVDAALVLRPPPQLIWLQQGVEDHAAEQRAVAAGIPFVMDRCLAVEHRHLEV